MQISGLPAAAFGGSAEVMGRLAPLGPVYQAGTLSGNPVAMAAGLALRQLGPGAPLLGAVFALGWTPCLGPTLTGVIAVASATDGATVARGVVLVLAYCLGLGIPFVLLALGSARAVTGLGWLRRHTRTIQILGGVLLILVGTALVTGLWNDFVSWVRDAFVSDVRLPI